jgi:hypothetical protein
MSWNKLLGFDKDLLLKADAKLGERQSYIMSMLAIMLICLSLICFASTLVYVLTIFHSWIIAITIGLFLAWVVFNLYRLFIMTAFNVSGSSLNAYYKKHEKHYAEHIEIGSDMGGLSDAEILEKSAVSKDQLRQKSVMNTSMFSDLFAISIQVICISIIALTFATGIEMYIFKTQINTILEELKNQYISHGDTWMVENTFTQTKDDGFYIFNTNSLLLIIDLLNRGLGNWKIVIDLLFLIVFFIPLILVIKSKEIRQGDYMRELALSEITISFYHYLHTQRFCQRTIKEVKETKIVFLKSSKVD